ncbi:31469_t:CDS:2, partial [Racocetra persica]
NAIKKLNSFVSDFKSTRLRQLFESFPDLKLMLTHFKEAFNYEKVMLPEVLLGQECVPTADMTE